MSPTRVGCPTRGTFVKIAVVNDYDLVSAGVRAVVADEPSMVVVSRESLADCEDVDIALYDPAGPEESCLVGSSASLKNHQTKVILYAWSLDPMMVQRALEAGAAGCLSKALPGPGMVAALNRIVAGETVVVDQSSETVPTPLSRQTDSAAGSLEGLSPRELEVLSLIAQGLTNLQIAAQIYVSINSVKAYIRSAYRKIGVERRTQAVLWGLGHGL